MSDAPKLPEEAAKRSCCDMRRKQTVFLGPTLPEDICGISDSILADFLRFDMEGPQNAEGRTIPVLGFRYCPWCGTAYTAESEVRMHALIETSMDSSEVDEGEEWKAGADEEEHPPLQPIEAKDWPTDPVKLIELCGERVRQALLHARSATALVGKTRALHEEAARAHQTAERQQHAAEASLGQAKNDLFHAVVRDIL